MLELRVINMLAPTIHVVAAHYNEDTSWLWLLRYPHTVCSKAGIPRGTPPNKGNEASTYLQWIIDNYANLPDYVIFIHAHRTSTHSAGEMDACINSLVFDCAYKNINNFPHFYLTDFPHAIKLLHTHKSSIERITGRHIVPENVVYRCCAQFYARRDCLQQYTVAQYAALLEWIMAFDGDGVDAGYIFEWLWRVIFTGDHYDN